MKTILASFAALFLAASVSAAPSKEEIREVLQKNPDIVLDVLKENKKVLFDIVNQAAQEEQSRRQREEEEAEKREFDEAFKNPKTADLNKANIRGNKDAKYTLVEYSDFQCPYCQRGYQNVETLRKKYGSKIRFVFKNLPLPFHPQAMPAAQWYEAAMLQSAEKGWKFHDKLFENQAKLGDELYKQLGKELGLDVAKLEKDAKSEGVKAKIEADMAEAKQFGFSGTPGYLLNGVPVKGAYPVEFFDSIIARIDTGGDKK